MGNSVLILQPKWVTRGQIVFLKVMVQELRQGLMSCRNMPGLGYTSVFSPEFTDQRAQILSHDHTHHLECSDCQYQTFVACVPLSPKHFSSDAKLLYSESIQFLSSSGY